MLWVLNWKRGQSISWHNLHFNKHNNYNELGHIKYLETHKFINILQKKEPHYSSLDITRSPTHYSGNKQRKRSICFACIFLVNHVLLLITLMVVHRWEPGPAPTMINTLAWLESLFRLQEKSLWRITLHSKCKRPGWIFFIVHNGMIIKPLN